MGREDRKVKVGTGWWRMDGGEWIGVRRTKHIHTHTHTHTQDVSVVKGVSSSSFGQTNQMDKDGPVEQKGLFHPVGCEKNCFFWTTWVENSTAVRVGLLKECRI